MWNKLGLINLSPDRMYLYIMDLICNGSKPILRNETS